MDAKPKRSERVSEALRVELTNLLARGAVRDPAVRDVVVTALKMTDDLRVARIYVRLLSAETTETQRQALLLGLRRAAAYIRRELSPSLRLKHLPELQFFWDQGLDHAARVEALLRDIREDGEGSA